MALERVIEPVNDKGVIHTIRFGGQHPLGVIGRWTADCFTIVSGFVLMPDEVEGKPCAKCAARRAKFSK
jgi:hypothetical protein